jgi:hypothetical protein
MFNAAAAYAQPVTITGTTPLGPNATDIASTTTPGTLIPLATADITVSGGGTLIVNGRHTIRSLVVQNNGLVTHQQGFTFDYSGGAGTDVINGMWLNVQADPAGTGGNVTVQLDGRIDATGRGFINNAGPGAGASGGYFACCAAGSGAGHGGTGATVGNSPVAPGGATYGSATEPSHLGSGGGIAGGAGGPGGGAIRLTVSGTLHVQGAVRANGANGTGAEGGGGSGGSIWVDAGSLSGTGLIVADGGIGNRGFGGGGGGGRIAVYSGSQAFGGTITAFGGTGAFKGGAGTIWTRQSSQERGDLFVANNGAGGRTPLPETVTSVNQLTVASGAELVVNSTLTASSGLITGAASRLSHDEGSVSGLQLIVVGNLVVGTESTIDVSGRGYINNAGPGAGASGGYFACCAAGSGAGHGGAGATVGNSPVATGGGSYGSVAEPSSLGSGGGIAGGAGGPGGGAIRLSIGGILTVQGTIRANGANGTGAEGGGGAGGSIWIDAGGISGAGAIVANGGIGNRGFGGGGGGGRIAVYAGSQSFSGTMTAFGGTGASKGGAGTIWTKLASEPLGDLLVANDGAGARTLLPIEIAMTDQLTVAGGAELVVTSLLALNSGSISGDMSRVSHPEGQLQGLRLVVAGDLAVGVGGAIDVSGRGYINNTGPGAGATGGYFACCAAGSGAGHGGAGATVGNSPVALGGGTYGSFTQPSDLGSGGGIAGGPGGSGGGVIRLSVGGTLSVDGAIRANGLDGTGAEGGGGSGGSIWIDAASISGTGAIVANGGIGNRGFGGGGGGGRIAIYSCLRLLPTTNITSLGGTGGNAGATNDVYFQTALITQQPISTVSCELADAVFDVAVIGPGPYTYQWRKGTVPLSDGPTATGTLIIGAASARLTLRGITVADEGSYDCIVSTACGGIPSTVATLLLSRPCSVADVVGTDGGPRVCGDSTVDGADFIAFINSFSVGDAAIDPIADIAGGGDTGELPDGTIDGTDFIAFINAFAIGC